MDRRPKESVNLKRKGGNQPSNKEPAKDREKKKIGGGMNKRSLFTLTKHDDQEIWLGRKAGP